MEQEYYTVRDVAKRFKVTEQFIRSEIGRKRLHANQIGGKWRISHQDVQDYERLTHTSNEEEDLLKIGA